MINWFKKWKLVDTTKYDIEPLGRDGKFQLSNKEMELSKKIYKEYGTLQYIFTPTGIGYNVEVKVLKTGEIFDITDYDAW